MHKTDIRSTAVSLEIREKKYIIKHVNSVLDSKQFAKKAHALSSSTVNVVCAKVTATTTTTSTQNMWNRMNNVTEKERQQQSIDSYDRTFLNNHSGDSSDEEDEEEEEKEDWENEVEEGEINDSDESELDIMGDSSLPQHSVQEEEEQSDDESEDEHKYQMNEKERRQQELYNASANLYEFHFEFGSKRPPRTTVIPSEDEEEEEEEEEIDITKGELHSDLEQDDGGSSSNDEQDWIKEEAEYKNVMADTKHFPSATDEALQVYENITDNIYIGSATGRSMAEESMPCECKYDSELDDPSEACGDDNMCINRMMFMECIVQDCPCGRLCQNRRFQLGQYAPVDVIKTEKKGFGLRALTNLPLNCFIMEYIGEVIPQTEFQRRTREYDMEGFKHYYFMTLKNDEIIDATKRGCLARFMNHSCNPNCVTQKWVIGKKMRIGIFTSRAIKAGEELTFDYKFERYGAIAQKCYCGEPNCKGYIGASDEKVMDEEVLTDTHMNTSSSGSSSDEDDYADEDDEDEEDLDIITVHRPQPLQDPDKVRSFVKRMLNSVGKPRLVNKLLMRLKMTNVDNSHGREILKMIVRLHGLKMLKFWLGEWKNNETIVLKALQVLEKLPLANRNGLEDCKLFDVVQKFTDHENEEISGLSQYLLDEWNDLKCVYRIPKRAHVELIRPPSDDDEEDMIMGDMTEEEEIEVASVRSAETSKTNNTTTTTTVEVKKPISAITTTTTPFHHNKKKKKRTRYESSREFFDPDNDYYEYLSMDASLEEIIWRLKYPPQSSFVPTAPKAMLNSSSVTSSTVYQPSQYHFSNHLYNHKKHTLPATATTGAYFSYSTNNNISAFNLTPSLSTSTDTITPSSSTSAIAENSNNAIHHDSTTYNHINTQNESLQQPRQQQHHPLYTEYYQDPSMYDYSRYYYAAAAAAEGMTVEEYYYAFQQQQQPASETPANAYNNTTTQKLPPNWQMLYTEDGSAYYYNTATQQTQWEVPIDQAKQVQPSAQNSGLGTSDSQQIENAVTVSEDKKKMLPDQPDDTTSSNNSPSSHHLLTPTSGSVDAASSSAAEDGPYLNDIDLKREVGKVVTKYLTCKQQALWKGDKHLFKDLARKVTHHIVDREMQSGRKIKAMDTALRIKIGKFIDAYGTDYVSKFMQRNPSISSGSSPSVPEK